MRDIDQGHGEILVQLGDLVLGHADGDVLRYLTDTESDVSKGREELPLRAGVHLPVHSHDGEVTIGAIHLGDEIIMTTLIIRRVVNSNNTLINK